LLIKLIKAVLKVTTTLHVSLFSILDKTLIVWKLTRDEANYGIPQKRLYGHSHFISDVVLSSDGNYALSGSWDKTLRLWDLAAGRTTRRFEDHAKVWPSFFRVTTIFEYLNFFRNWDRRKICHITKIYHFIIWDVFFICLYDEIIVPQEIQNILKLFFLFFFIEK